MKGVDPMNMISSLRLYSGRSHIVPGGTDAVGGEDVAEIGKAAVKRGPAAETFGDEHRNRTMCQCSAQATILRRQPGHRGLHGLMLLSGGMRASRLAMPGR